MCEYEVALSGKEPNVWLYEKLFRCVLSDCVEVSQHAKTWQL